MKSPSIALPLLALSALLLTTGCGESSEPASSSGSLTDSVQSAADSASNELNQSADQASSAAQDAADSAPSAPSAPTAEDQAQGQEAMSQYLSGMEELSSVARSINDRVSAVAKTPEVKAALDQVKEAWAALDELNPELKQQLIQVSQSQLDSLTNTIQSEADRLANDLGLPDVAEMLRQATSLGS